MGQGTRPSARRIGWMLAGGALVVVAIAVVVVVLVNQNTSGRTPARRSALERSNVAGKRIRISVVSPVTSVAALGTQTVAGAAGGPSGVPLPLGSPPGWKRVFADAFPASEDAPLGSFSGCRWVAPPITSHCTGLPAGTQRKWFAEPDHASLAGTAFVPGKVLSIHGGELQFDLHGGPTGEPDLAAAEPRIGVGGSLGAFRAGLFALRFRSAAIPGYTTAFELWPVSKDARDGVLQFPAGAVNGPIEAIVGQTGIPYGNPDVVTRTHSRFTAWHTAVIEWASGTVRFLLDGRQVGPTQAFKPLSPLRWLLYAGPPQGGASRTDGKTGTLRVAWVAAYVQSRPGVPNS